MLTRLLQASVAIEIVGAVVFAVGWLRDPAVPDRDLAQYHPATADAIRELERTVYDSSTSDNWLSLGKAYLAFGLFPQGEYCCEQAARGDAEAFEALYWWGVALNQLGETTEAIEKFQLAITLAHNQSPSDDAEPRCWYGIGRNYLREENAADAEQAFRKAADYLPARHQLIRILVRSDRAAEAIPMLDELLSRYPKESTFYQLRARAREQTGDHDGAFEDRTRVERAPDRLRSDSIIAELQMEAGGMGLYRELGHCGRLMAEQPPQAVTCLRELLSAEWRNELAETLVEAELQVGNAQQAADLLNELMKRDGTTAERLAQLAYCHQWLGQDDVSFKLLIRSARLMHMESVHNKLSKGYLDRGETTLADKHSALASLTRGIAAFREDRVSEARSQLEHALRIDPDLPNAWYYLAECHRVRGEFDEAVDALKRCLKVHGNHGRAHSRLSRLTQ